MPSQSYRSRKGPLKSSNSDAPQILRFRITDNSTSPEDFVVNIKAQIVDSMPSAAPSDEPDAGTLCDYVPILAQMDVAQAFKNGKEIAPAAEMTLSGMQDSEEEAFYALLDVYAMSYQRVVDRLERKEPVGLEIDPINFDITMLVHLCAFLGTYQASKDIKVGVKMESQDRVEDVGEEAMTAVLDVAERAVKEYHLVCASQYLWELQRAERVLLAEDIVRVEKVDDGVGVVMMDSTKHVVIEGDVGAVVYARLLAMAEKRVLGEEAAKKGADGGGGGGGGGYPAVNAGTASENMYG